MENKEKCVLCGKVTLEEINRPIKERKYYVSGSGQLCKDCYDKTYKNKN